MRFTTETALALLLVAGSASAKSFHRVAIAKRADPFFEGCYSSAGSLSDSKEYTYQSTGYCSTRCSGMNASVLATTDSKYCLCGDSLPPSSDKVDKSKCDSTCQGYPEEMCGGDGFYSVYSLGGSDSSATTSTGDSSPTKTDAAAESISTNAGGHTVVVTAPAAESTNSDGDKSKGGTNTAAIAAGVVVGVVGVAALAGGAFFFYRSRKQKAEGGAGATGFSRNSHQQMSDSRFDGSYMAQRRQSNGSIDDDHDFSRRILQVTNPDHRY